MEPGSGSGPYNPCFPPPPPPPGYGGPFHPPDAFHRPNPTDVNYHPFHHFSGPPDHFSGPPDHFNGPPDPFNGPPDQLPGPPGHFNEPPDHFHGPPDHFSGAGGGYGHPKPNFFRKRKFDGTGNYAKLYVGAIPRDVTQEEVGHMFEEFGNVIEVVLLTDKKTGQQQEYCFVKYASIEEAESAIMALHNRITFPRAMTQLRVKYADGEKQRLGLDHFVLHDSSHSRSGPVQHDMTMSGPVDGESEHKVTKVFVNGFNRESSLEEVKEIFSSFGVVVDIYIMRDSSKRSRGCGFVGFSHRYMAVAAINGLNGTYVMRGCNKPLIVRFADPKKPKNVDSRAHTSSEDMRQNNIFSALPMGNPAASTKLNSPGVVTGTFCPVVNQLCPDSSEIQQMVPVNPCSPSPWSQMSLQEPLTLQISSHSQLSGQMDFQKQTPMHHDHQSQVCRDAEFDSHMLSPEPVPSVVSAVHISEDPLYCVWSEHICPDGEKYYYNSVTSASRWDKPEEFVIFEQLRLKQIEAARLHRPFDFDKAQLSGSCAA